MSQLKSEFYSNKEENINAFSHLFFALIFLILISFDVSKNLFTELLFLKITFLLTFLSSFFYHFTSNGQVKYALSFLDSFFVFFSFLVALLMARNTFAISGYVIVLFSILGCLNFYFVTKFGFSSKDWKKTFIICYVSMIIVSIVILRESYLNIQDKLILYAVFGKLHLTGYFFYNFKRKYHHLIHHILTGLAAILYTYIFWS